MPSTKLFADYANMLIDVYEIRGVVTRDHAVSIRRCGPHCYEVRTKGGRTVKTRRIVCALGPNLQRNGLFWAPATGTYPDKTLIHSNDLAAWLCQFSAQTQTSPFLASQTRVLVVGGGITSAHVIRVLRELGCMDIVLLTRSELRTSQFDLQKSSFGPARGRLYSRRLRTPISRDA